MKKIAIFNAPIEEIEEYTNRWIEENDMDIIQINSHLETNSEGGNEYLTLVILYDEKE